MPDPARPAPSRILIDNLATWLMQKALGDHTLEETLTGCCDRLLAAGVPLTRAFFAFSVLHPLHRAVGLTWTRGKGVTTADYPHVPGGESDAFVRSPHHYMLERKLDVLRIRLDQGQPGYAFPVLAELQAEGLTDYLAFTTNLHVIRDYGMAGSWATDAPGGFREDDIEHLIRIERRLAVACKVAIQSVFMRNLATTYLGPVTAANVLEGQIKRGDGQSIEAAIWFSDLRGSTRLAETLPRQEFIATLNRYFDLTGGAVEQAGGEILAFVGDGLLAIFPFARDASGVETASARAMSATVAALERQRVENAQRKEAGLEPLTFGLGLHLGEVMYGNVGVPDRLTFSAFGVAVHEVDRLQGLTKELGHPVLASEAFAKAATTGRWRALGTHNLRGVDRPMQVHALDAAAA